MAFIGISNWQLDASKMNRGITLNRPDISEEELVDTAKSISEQMGNKNDQFNSLQFGQIANFYFDYIQQLKKLKGKMKNFHGLRDFYFTIKNICQVQKNRARDTDQFE